MLLPNIVSCSLFLHAIALRLACGLHVSFRIISRLMKVTAIPSDSRPPNTKILDINGLFSAVVNSITSELKIRQMRICSARISYINSKNKMPFFFQNEQKPCLILNKQLHFKIQNNFAILLPDISRF